MFYIDDSGASSTGYVVFSWIECNIADWRVGLRAWLDLRRRLFTERHIPPAYELHATSFVNGRGRPSANADWNLRKSNRVAVTRLALETIGQCPALSVGTVYRRFVKPRDLGAARSELYHALVGYLDGRLADAGELGIVLMDGDDGEPTYDPAHRALKLEHRRIIEDPLFRVSSRSQWIQMADLVAYCAYESLLRHPGKKFMWDCYDLYLRDCDVSGGPIEL